MKGTPHPTDVYVGQRLRAFRHASGISQGQVAKHLGITFQQVQKYEKGTNRIAPSRLLEAAELFGVPISDFFPMPDTDGTQSSQVSYDWSKAEFEVASLFALIESPEMRRSIHAIIKAAAQNE